MSTSPPKSNQLEGRTLGNYPRPHAWMPVPSCKAVLSSPCILAQLHKIPPAIAAIVKYCFTATLLLVLTADTFYWLPGCLVTQEAFLYAPRLVSLILVNEHRAITVI